MAKQRDYYTCFNAETRRDWNNVILPGNYVARLNAYRDQGVTAIPGVNFFRQVGAVVITPEDNCGSLLDANGELPAGTYAVKILSPDLRPDDKPRLDRPLTVPAGATIYRTSVNALNLTGVPDELTGDMAGGDTITVAQTADSVGSVPAAQAAVLTSSDGTATDGYCNEIPAGYFNACGAVAADPFAGLSGLTQLTKTCDPTTNEDVLVAVTTATPLKPLCYCGGGSGYANADPDNGQTAILVEVCFFMDAPAPIGDDVNLPFPIEAGQSRN
jgi:hypothetical protein